MNDPRLAVGVMSGTSIDGLDAALVRIEGRGLEMRATLLHHAAAALGELGPRLRAVAEQAPVTAGEIAAAAWQFGLLHVNLVEHLLSPPSPHTLTPSLICVHGQTVYHCPPISFQLINTAPIGARWPQAMVVSDLRQHDLALGGQGAPITPLADWILFRDKRFTRAVVNLGGFCNVTVLPRDDGKGDLAGVRGFDVCACNHLTDWVARTQLGRPFDEAGAAAMRGACHEPLLAALRTAAGVSRSLGTGDEHFDILKRFEQLSAEDMLASICEAIACNIAAAIGDVDQVILAGGGAYNHALVAVVRSRVSCEVIASKKLGVPLHVREAMAMAILGALHLDGVPITLPHVTGRITSSNPGNPRTQRAD